MAFEFTSSKYKDIITNHFKYSNELEFLDVVADVIDLIDYFDDEEDYDIDRVIYEAIDRATLYYYEQWRVLEHYCTPTEANWDIAYEALYNDVYAIMEKIKEEGADEKEETEEWD